ncbi:MAG: DUF1475 family protein [Chryseolinea sp.]
MIISYLRQNSLTSHSFSMKTFLKILLSCVLIFMIWEIIDTSMESNLFAEWHTLGKIPWMQATLYDFYANILCLYLWMFYKEQSVLKKILWLIFLVTMGSVATCVYILKELFALNEDEDLKTLLIRQNS